MNTEIWLTHRGTIQVPVTLEGVKLTWERKGTPGKLEFTVVKDKMLVFVEGDLVQLRVDGTPVFVGFVFRKKRDKDGTIQVTAYDQLRYLKNKDTYIGAGVKASELLQSLANTFRLQLGAVEDTEYPIDVINETNITLFDLLQNALDETLTHTGKLFVLYDEAGKLCLKNINSMKLNILIDKETAENFSYESGIDGQTYNRIKLTYDNDRTGKRESTVVQDGEKMNQWGVLQYFESVQTPIGAPTKAAALLKLYGQKTRKLTVQNAFGDIRVRGGSAVAVSLDLGDIIANQYLVVNRVVHTFQDNAHRMDLDLLGGEFIV